MNQQINKRKGVFVMGAIEVINNISKIEQTHPHNLAMFCASVIAQTCEDYCYLRRLQNHIEDNTMSLNELPSQYKLTRKHQIDKELSLGKLQKEIDECTEFFTAPDGEYTRLYRSGSGADNEYEDILLPPGDKFINMLETMIEDEEKYPDKITFMDKLVDER